MIAGRDTKDIEQEDSKSGGCGGNQASDLTGPRSQITVLVQTRSCFAIGNFVAAAPNFETRIANASDSQQLGEDQIIALTLSSVNERRFSVWLEEAKYIVPHAESPMTHPAWFAQREILSIEKLRKSQNGHSVTPRNFLRIMAMINRR